MTLALALMTIAVFGQIRVTSPNGDAKVGPVGKFHIEDGTANLSLKAAAEATHLI